MGNTLVRDIMQEKIVTISVDDSLATVEDIMHLGGVRHLPVVRGGRLVGVVSKSDLLRLSLSTLNSQGNEYRRAFLQALEVSQAMSSPPIVVEAYATVEKAAMLLAQHKIGCLPVLDGDALVGLMTTIDLLSHLAGVGLRRG
jgi:acetoin utilization protein AcuB